MSDDYLSVEKNLSSRFTYSNNNFSYAESFSSINSSCGSPADPLSEESKEIACFGSSEQTSKQSKSRKKKISSRLRSFKACFSGLDMSCGENQQALYSVKNGAIHYNLSPGNVQVRDHEDSRPWTKECYRPNELESIYKTLQRDAPQILESQDETRLNHSVIKSSSLKKLKKDAAMKKAVVGMGPVNGQHEVVRSHLIDSFRGIYETYHYLNSKEVILNPDQIIASIV